MPDGDTDGGSETGVDVDPVTLEVARNACAAVAEEMNATLVRTAYSPNVTERRDCSCALFDAGGSLVAQAENIPVHLGAMPFSVTAALEAFPPSELEPGDAVLLNDPFRGGAHLPDLTLVTPVFTDDAAGGDDPIAFVANRAHHADVGGSRAGGVAADSTEIYQEGLRIPPVKLYEGGEPNEGVFDTILANVRTPDERRGDLRAQVAANETGAERYRELHVRYGGDLPAITAAIQDYAERRTRAEIRELPDGEYAFADALDDDGRGTEDVRIEATVAVDDDGITVDFDGTAPQTRGPINAVFAVTASATYYAVRCVTDPDVPPNAGAYRPVEVRAPEGTVVNPDPPAAVVGGNLETSQRVTDVVLGALAACAPERAAAAGQGTMNNVTFGGTDPREVREDDGSGRQWAFYETGGGGAGAHAAGDGMDGVHVHMSNTLNTPVEVLETAYPLRVRRYTLRPDSGGAGAYRGGLGLRRDIEVRGETQFSLLADRHRHRPYGLAGGEPGASGAAFHTPGDAGAGGDEVTERLPPKTTLDLDPGDVVSVRSPGGGGYGDPADRAAAGIKRDLRLGKLSAEAARERYGYEAADGENPE
ncbi:hydantoinase B/oxoprolinase family protein [Haloglomus litoreum]|uniref:hydantoinase B/oxoprolinase family protein n=1 Tax=Haloglomus litoreum TaxID=3034026 RepID=UPI0023E7CF4B|nr:hydantoinase B/oxoprolinase family protein [Haloglomus sp. DT116]